MPQNPPQFLTMGAIAVGLRPLSNQDWRASGNIGIGSLACPDGNGISVSVFDKNLNNLPGSATVSSMIAVPDGPDKDLWSGVSAGTTESWTTQERVYFGGASGVTNNPFFVQVYASYSDKQLSSWKTGTAGTATNIDGLLSATLSLTGPFSGQQYRSSGNFTTQVVSGGTTPSKVKFEIRTALVGVDPWQCPTDSSTSVTIMEDVHGAPDQTIWTSVKDGTTFDYASYTNLYVGGPTGADSPFYVLVYGTT